jgi:hypothetical protein
MNDQLYWELQGLKKFVTFVAEIGNENGDLNGENDSNKIAEILFLLENINQPETYTKDWKVYFSVYEKESSRTHRDSSIYWEMKFEKQENGNHLLTIIAKEYFPKCTHFYAEIFIEENKHNLSSEDSVDKFVMSAIKYKRMHFYTENCLIAVEINIIEQ